MELHLCPICGGRVDLYEIDLGNVPVKMLVCDCVPEDTIYFMNRTVLKGVLHGLVKNQTLQEE